MARSQRRAANDDSFKKCIRSPGQVNWTIDDSSEGGDFAGTPDNGHDVVHSEETSSEYKGTLIIDGNTIALQLVCQSGLAGLSKSKALESFVALTRDNMCQIRKFPRGGRAVPVI